MIGKTAVDMRVAKRRNGEWYAVERERFDRNQLRKKDLLNALGISALSRAPPSPRLSMGINIHDPLVQIKGTYPYPPLHSSRSPTEPSS